MNSIYKLVQKLNKYRNAYYNENTSLASDAVYDQLFDELVALEKETGIVYANSPTQTVGYSVASSLQRIEHSHPLLSLDKTTDIDKFNDFMPGQSILTAKLDGLTCSITYESGKLVRAETRGDGRVGEDITHNAKFFANLPLLIPIDHLVVDGEVIIDYDTFEAINKAEGTEYKHPRNLASGTVRQLDSSIVAKRNVKFIAWKLVSSSLDDKDIPTLLSDALDALANFGFEVVPYYVPEPAASDDMQPGIDRLVEDCKELGYPIDGIVKTVNDMETWDDFAGTAHHPGHSLAFKFAQSGQLTTLRDIEWQVSRTGTLNPVAVFDTVEIDGTDVSRASLSNVSIIRDLHLGISDTISVIKANQIIPQIVENLTESDSYELPEYCPACGHPVEIKNNNGRETLVCTCEWCSGKRLDKLVHFVSRDGMDIRGLSENRLKAFIKSGWLDTYATIYELPENVIAQYPGMGKASAAKLMMAIDKSRQCNLANVLIAIGVPHVGKANAQVFATHVHQLNSRDGMNEECLNFLITLVHNDHDWSQLPGFGPTTSKDINEYIKANAMEIRDLSKFLDVKEDSTWYHENEQDMTSLAGLTFCITGKLHSFPNRDALVQFIQEHGGKVVGSISKNTMYLITNDASTNSSKIQKAAACKTRVITEDELIDMADD